ncbi:MULTISPECIES: DUF423 domain-containing protein [Oceanospirillaceae]|jgi:uncharacterized membrane protein YgdD (TMEM256/DUF423 family)|uniref:DUF423 domain-containing protein n=1 Tax=Oceanobacter antarcticus TaxID=3133425 RepID=A0ABW8NLX6_9GAMM
MQARMTLMLAAIAGFLGVALGAFGAHGLKDHLTPPMMTVYQTAVDYHLLHAAVLLGLGVWQLQQPQVWLNRAALFMVLGLLLFCGSLYAMVLLNIRMLGMITPIGGVSWLIGWGLLFIAARSMTTSTSTD